MKKIFTAVLCLFAIAAVAQDAPKDQPNTIASVMNQQLKSGESEVVSLAEALPDNVYTFAPSQGEFKGVRNVAAQLKHIAAVNYIIGGAISGQKPPDTNAEKGPDNIKSKAEVVKYLKDSFDYLHKAFDGLTAENLVEPIPAPWGDAKTTRLGMATIGVAHPFDHYGQLVVYGRMNGVIPPASRQQ